MSSLEKYIQVGTRVKVTGKDVCGTVAYFGYPTFATGKWVGVILDEAKGKNNGTIRGHAYFTCHENYGMFVRVTQLTLIDEEGQPLDVSVTSPEDTKASRSRLTSVVKTSSAQTKKPLTKSQVVISLVGRLPPMPVSRKLTSTENCIKFNGSVNVNIAQNKTPGHGSEMSETGKLKPKKLLTTIIITKKIVSALTESKIKTATHDCSLVDSPSAKPTNKSSTLLKSRNYKHFSTSTNSHLSNSSSGFGVRCDEENFSSIVSKKNSGSRQSLTGSRQSLVGAMASPGERASTPDTTIKRAAFVETNFVETFSPQFTPGQSITSPQQQIQHQPVIQQMHQQASSTEDKLALLQSQQENTQLKATIEDLTEKLETLKIKRLEDREKLKELDRLKLQFEQMNEFKAKIMESQASLQRDLQRAKAEAREAQAARDAHAEEMADLSETAEMAALDKEMAEEKAETLQLELDSCRERLEEALLDLQLLRAELDAAGVKESGGSTYELRQLEQQNARLRDTLVRLRDLSAHEKHHMQKMQKDLDQKKSEIAELGRTKEKLSSRVEELEVQIADLQEQIELNDVDAALGAEEMVEQLGERKMALEDEVVQLKEEVAELEALQEVHEQLVESNHELEQDLREELDMSHAATREAIREREAALETVLDRDQTIQKFRELVQKLNEQCQQYRDRLNEKDVAQVVEQQQPLEVLGNRQANTRAVDLQLRALQLRQAVEHATLLRGYMPDHIMQRGGDHDAILGLLLIPRMICKAEIIIGQLREKFPSVSHIDRDVVLKKHTTVQFSFRCRMQYQLHMLMSVLQQYNFALAQGSVQTLLKIAGALPELVLQERPLDAVLDLLRADRLDENTSTADLEKSYAILFKMQHTLLGPQEPDPGVTPISGEAPPITGLGGDANKTGPAWVRPGEAQAVRAWCAAISAACDGLQSDGNVLKVLLQGGEECSDLQQLEHFISASTETVLQQLKTIRRRLPADNATLDLEADWWERVAMTVCSSVWRAASVCHEACRLASQAAALCEPSRLPAANLKKLWEAASDRHYAQDDQGPLVSIKASLQIVLAEVANLSQYTQQRELQIHSSLKQDNKIVPPIVQRADMIKKQLEETKSLTLRLENREADLRELKKLLKAKQDEMSEMQIRKELAEKKLSSSARDQELQVEKLSRKLEDAHNQLKRKEKEFEETMDHLQQDIDSLELERGALRDKLKMYGKKGDRSGITSSDISSSMVEGRVSGSRSGTESEDSLHEELTLLHRQYQKEREERLYLERSKCAQIINSLTPLPVPHNSNKLAENERLNKLREKFHKFQFEWTMFLGKSAVCTFPDDPTQYERVLKEHKERQRIKRMQLMDKLEEIQREVREEFLSRRPWRSVETSLVKFPHPELSRNSRGTEVCRVEYPASTVSSPINEVFASRSQLQQIRDALENLGAKTQWTLPEQQALAAA